MKCGFVSLVGRPNVGKSTLLNSVLGMKLAITSNVSGTTRNVIQGIYNDEDSQIVFVDTPGIHKPTHKLGNLMNKKAYNNTEGVDIVLFLIDISKGFGKGDQFILDRIKDKGVPIFLLLNKIDQVKNKEKLLSEINKLKELYDFAEIIPISAMKKDNVDTLVIDIPAGTYANGCQYCIFTLQAIPTAATVNMPVAISIGGDTTTVYPLVCSKTCIQATASQVRARARYCTKVQTNVVSGVFKAYSGLSIYCPDTLASLPVSDTTAQGG